MYHHLMDVDNMVTFPHYTEDVFRIIVNIWDQEQVNSKYVVENQIFINECFARKSAISKP